MEEYKEKRTDLVAFSKKAMQLREEINKVVIGQQEAVALSLTAILTDDHMLMGGVPGVAKTLLARLLSRLTNTHFSRTRFAPDLTPNDVLGMIVFNMKTSEFDLHEGPVFSDLALVDEINRVPAKTQAALFEVMEGCQVTIGGTARRMSDVYTVIVTQNPVKQKGTYRLPEARLSRFLLKISTGYPSVDEEMNILKRHQEKRNPIKSEDVKPILAIDEFLQMRKKLDMVFVEKSLLRYIANIAQQTCTSKAVCLGASPRASVAMLSAAKASALLGGYDFVTPEDTKFVTPSILQYHLILTAEVEMKRYTPLEVAQKLIDRIGIPK